MENSRQTISLVAKAREVYQAGQSVEQFLRDSLQVPANTPDIVELSYDLQAGAYRARRESDPEAYARNHDELFQHLQNDLETAASWLDAGCGEAVTVQGLIERLQNPGSLQFTGTDIALSPLLHAQRELVAERSAFYVAQTSRLPFADDSFDLVTSFATLMYAGDRLSESLAEMMRVSRHRVVLVECLIGRVDEELVPRLRELGYSTMIEQAARALPNVDITVTPVVNNLNPRTPVHVVSISKHGSEAEATSRLQCPVTGDALRRSGRGYLITDSGLVYPEIEGIPLLRRRDAIVCSALVDGGSAPK